VVAWSTEQLRPLVDDPGRAGVLLDFDGTLAPIVVDPDTARPLPGAITVLGAVARRYRLAAVVSGRPAAFLAHHLDVPGLERWGSYGAERVAADGSIEVVEAAERWRPVVAEAVDAARATAPPGVRVEDKGVSLTLHVRADPSLEPWVRDFARRQAAASGLEVHDARMSAELRPPIALDKGTVVRRLAAGAGLQAALFVGDDRGDLAAFAALDAVTWALRVAVRSDEAPEELLLAADVVVEGPSGVLELLRALVG
jgi:trehalose 6-phosphate phosphatase